jgi:hypothetical protein
VEARCDVWLRPCKDKQALRNGGIFSWALAAGAVEEQRIEGLELGEGSLPVLGREMGSSGTELLAMSTNTITLSFQQNNQSNGFWLYHP